MGRNELYAEVPRTDAIVAAVGWVESLLTGPLATSVAVLAVAGVGFTMLTGRIDVRRAASVVMGCFLIFGAPLIAAALRGLIEPTSIVLTVESAPPTTMNGPYLPAYRAPAPDAFDPYASTSAPQR